MNLRNTIATLVVLCVCIPLPGAAAAGAQAARVNVPPRPPQASEFDMTGHWLLSYYAFLINGIHGGAVSCTYHLAIKKVQPDPGSPFFYPYPSTGPNGPTATSYYFTGTYAAEDDANLHPGWRNQLEHPCIDGVFEPGSVGNYSVDSVFVGWLGIAQPARPFNTPVSRGGVMVMTQGASSKANAATSKGFLAAYEGAFYTGGATARIAGQRSESGAPCVLTPGSAACGTVWFTLTCESGPCSKTWNR